MYRELMAELTRGGETLKSIAPKIGRTPSYMWRCTGGDRDFTIPDGYKILDCLGLPHSEFTRVFPRG